jgi:hypothetical protein
MKCSSLKYSGSETKILSLDNIRVRIDPMMQSPRLLLTGQAPVPLGGLDPSPSVASVHHSVIKTCYH